MKAYLNTGRRAALSGALQQGSLLNPNNDIPEGALTFENDTDLLTFENDLELMTFETIV